MKKRPAIRATESFLIYKLVHFIQINLKYFCEFAEISLVEAHGCADEDGGKDSSKDKYRRIVDAFRCQ